MTPNSDWWERAKRNSRCCCTITPTASRRTPSSRSGLPNRSSFASRSLVKRINALQATSSKCNARVLRVSRTRSKARAASSDLGSMPLCAPWFKPEQILQSGSARRVWSAEASGAKGQIHKRVSIPVHPFDDHDFLEAGLQCRHRDQNSRSEKPCRQNSGKPP